MQGFKEIINTDLTFYRTMWSLLLELSSYNVSWNYLEQNNPQKNIYFNIKNVCLVKKDESYDAFNFSLLFKTWIVFTL